MKHAYLILAHNQFELLRLLVHSLDDIRNDIYIHLDRKVKERPNLSTQHASLYWTAERIDVRWGAVSVVQAEMVLFEEASRRGNYAYYHLLSGVDLPLKTQDYIHSFFAQHQGKEFVGFYHGADLTDSLIRKVQRRHLFSDSFRESSGIINFSKHILRALYLRFQEALGITINRKIDFHKGTQWISITDVCVRGLLSQKAEILAIYKDSFCSDEIFVQTYLMHSALAPNIYDREDEARGCMRHIGWSNNQLADFTTEDLPTLQASEALFARKFNERDLPTWRSMIDSLQV